MFVSPYVCDRRIYNKKGKWKNPNNDVEEVIFYFIKEPLTLTSDYVNGKEEVKETLTIVIFGSKPIVGYDEITLENGKKMVVSPDGIVYNEVERNPLVLDMLKPRYASIEVALV